MFSHGSKSSSEPPSPARETPAPAARPSGEPSIISADLRVVGDLHCSGDLQVKGNVEGDIKSRSVTIGSGAHVQGSVIAETVHISGSIEGEIKAPAVSVAKSGRVVGDIIHQTLAVEAGAHLDGHCRRMDSKPAKGAEAGAGLSSVKAATTPLGTEKKAAS